MTMKKDKPLIGRQIRYLRRQRDMSQGEISAKTGITISYLSKIENEKCDVRAELLQKIANALGVEVASLFEDSVTESASYQEGTQDNNQNQ